jgi:iron-sulfur cluster assembly accessory protein
MAVEVLNGLHWVRSEMRISTYAKGEDLSSHAQLLRYLAAVAIIAISQKAEKELAQLLARKGASATAGLRLGVSKGGCAGWQYEMKVAEPEHGDEIVESGAARVIVAADSFEKLRGCEVDFSDDLTDAGFKIHNPKARRSCGCGTSFEPEDEPEGSGAEDGEVCGGGGAA